MIWRCDNSCASVALQYQLFEMGRQRFVFLLASDVCCDAYEFRGTSAYPVTHAEFRTSFEFVVTFYCNFLG